MRKFLFWVHLLAGVTAGLIVVLMSVTGVLLTYEKQIRAWADRGSLTLSGGAPLPLAELLQRAGAKPGTPVTLRQPGPEPVELSLGGKDGNVYLDPATGTRLGRNSTRTQETLAAITAWHRRLGVDGPARNTARLITGVCNLAFLVMILSGVYLWLPRKWTAQHLRPIVWFRGGLSGKARDFNWHNAIGLWCAIPLAALVLGAVPISFVWASDLVFKAMGTQPPKPAGPPPGGPPPVAPTGAAALEGLDELVARARAQHSGWRAINFRVPSSTQAPLVFQIDWGTGGEPQKKGTLTLFRGAAADQPPKWEAFEHFDAGRRMRLWLRFLHTGEALGMAGQTIAGIASAGAVVLGWTGVALALRRWQAWRRRTA